MACSPVDVPRREAAIAQALANKLEQRAKDRAEAAAKARAENEAFTKEFLNKAREVFELIDKDDSGSLAIDEITTAVKSDKVVKDFLKTCGDETLMFLLQPKRLDHALRELDTIVVALRKEGGELRRERRLAGRKGREVAFAGRSWRSFAP